MKRLMCGVLMAVLAALLPTGQAQTGQQPSDADWDWFGQFRPQAFDALMPMTAGESLVAYRSYRDLYYEVMERHFVIRYNPGGVSDKDKLTASVVVPVGRSIQKQLLDLHMKERTASFESLLSRVAVRRVTLDSASCRAVRDRMDRLSQVRIGVGERDVIQLHPVMHRFVVNLSAGKIDATLRDSESPLVTWGVETTAALLACADR